MVFPFSGRDQSGVGSVRRSTLPLGVSGKASKKTKDGGTMQSGSVFFKKLCNSLAVGTGACSETR